MIRELPDRSDAAAAQNSIKTAQRAATPKRSVSSRISLATALDNTMARLIVAILVDMSDMAVALPPPRRLPNATAIIATMMATNSPVKEGMVRRGMLQSAPKLLQIMFLFSCILPLSLGS